MFPKPQHLQTSRHQGRTSDGDLVRYFGYGSLNHWQARALRRYVHGKHVYDFGAGGLYYAHRLTELGAASVTAVDAAYEDRANNFMNDYRSWKKCAPKGVEIDPRTFAEFYLHGPQAIDVAFVSWPHSTYTGTIGLELIVRKAKVVIYLGCNFGGTSCGSSVFWDALYKRKVLAHAPARPNSLIVYGEYGKYTKFSEDGSPDCPDDELAAFLMHSGEEHWCPVPDYFL